MDINLKLTRSPTIANSNIHIKYLSENLGSLFVFKFEAGL
jgi:hypothetical protein